MSGHAAIGAGLRLPDADELRLLRAALLEGDAAVAAWHELNATGSAIDKLAGDAYSLAPQLFRNLLREGWDDPLMGRLRGIYRRAWYSNQLMLQAAAQALDALTTSGIRPLLIGGAGLVVAHVDDLGARPCGPLELLVPPRDRVRAIAALESLGWFVDTGTRRRGDRLRAQLRAGLSRGRDDHLVLRFAWRALGLGPELWAAAGSAPLPGGSRASVLGAADQLLLVCGRSRYRWPPPLRWITDATLLLRSAGGDLDWDRLIRRARSRGVCGDLARALEYLALEFAPAAPATTIARLRMPARRRLRRRARQLLGAPSRARPDAAAGGAREPHAGVRPPAPDPRRAHAPDPSRADARLTVERARRLHGLVLDHALIEAVRALAESGIQPVLLKGPAFARWLYDDPGDRPYFDIDLIVAPELFERAETVLASLGYESRLERMRPSERGEHSSEWRRSAGPLAIAIELHHAMSLIPAHAAGRFWKILSEGGGTVEVAGGAVPVPDAPTSALIVALHAAQHGRREDLPMSDLRRALLRVPLSVWADAAAQAAELDVVGAFACGLALEPAGPDLCSRLGLQAASVSRVIRLQSSSPPPGAVRLELLVHAESMRDRLRMLVAVLVPSREYMRAVSPDANRGRMGLARAYLGRPAYLVHFGPAAVLAWLRVQGSAFGAAPLGGRARSRR